MPSEDVKPEPVTTPAPLPADKVVDDDYDDEFEESTPAPSTPETPAEETQPVVSEKPKHSRFLILQARDLGISQEEIDDTPTKQLERVVYYLNKQQRQRPDEPKVEAKTAPVVEEDMDLGIDEAVVEPSIVKAMKKLAKGQKDKDAKIAALEQELGTVKQNESRREAQTAAERIDAGFGDLGPEYESIFGKGRGNEMEASDRCLHRRRAVLQSLNADPPKTGTLRDNVRRRALELFGQPDAVQAETPEPEPKPAPSKKKGPTQEEWNEAALARPTQRANSSEKYGVKRAEKAAHEFLKSKGVVTGPMSGDEEYDSLPD